MKKYLIPFICILLGGCITDNTPTTGEQAKEYLEIWMAKWNKDNGKNIQPDEYGMYVLDDVPGDPSADLWSADIPYTYASVTINTLSGKISSSDDATIAKQLGTYQAHYYYGPKVSVTGEGASYAGVDLALKDMRMGGRRTVLIPSWMLTTSRYSSMQEYLDACTSSSHLIYTIDLKQQFEDVNEWEKAIVKDYIDAHFPGAESTVMPDEEEADGSFYFISDTSAFDEEDKRESNASGLRLNYTGYRLDGQIFDTTIEDVAIDAGIYNSSSSYTPASMSFSDSWDSIKMNSSSEYITGFQAALSMLWWVGQKATVVFTSARGYSYSGNSGAIPGYCPIAFDLELLGEE